MVTAGQLGHGGPRHEDRPKTVQSACVLGGTIPQSNTREMKTPGRLPNIKITVVEGDGDSGSGSGSGSTSGSTSSNNNSSATISAELNNNACMDGSSTVCSTAQPGKGSVGGGSGSNGGGSGSGSSSSSSGRCGRRGKGGRRAGVLGLLERVDAAADERDIMEQEEEREKER